MWQYAIVYTDDVIIFSKLLEEHVKHIEEIFGLVRAAKMTPKLKKCHFVSESIDFLGDVIGTGKLQVAKPTTKGMESLQYPDNISQMRFLRDLCSVYRHFVPGFAAIDALLNKKLKKKESSHFVSDDQKGKAVNELKNRLVNTPVSALPRAKEQYTVDTDA